MDHEINNFIYLDRMINNYGCCDNDGIMQLKIKIMTISC